MIGLVAATCAATGWQWYAASLEVHYHEVQGVQKSLIFSIFKRKKFFLKKRTLFVDFQLYIDSHWFDPYGFWNILYTCYTCVWLHG